jgi:hypothetical protein
MAESRLSEYRFTYKLAPVRLLLLFVEEHMKSFVRNSFRALSVLGLVAAGVTGCGGGGGGGGGSSSSAPTLVITEDNAQAVASSVIQTVDAMFDLSSATGDQVTPSAAGAATAGRASAVRRVLNHLSRSHAHSLGAQPLVAVGPVTEPCDVSGTVTLSGNLANPETLSNGDRITASFDQCQDFDPLLLDGGLALRVRDIQGDFLTDVYLLTVDLTFTNLSVTDGTENFTADGDCTLTLDSLDFPSSRSRIAGRLLALSSSQEAVTLTDFDQSLDVDATVLPETYVAEALGALASDLLGGRVNYITVTPVLAEGDSDPDAGELLVTGADGTTVRIVIVDVTSVRLDIDVDGDGTSDATQNTTWSALIGDT